MNLLTIPFRSLPRPEPPILSLATVDVHRHSLIGGLRSQVYAESHTMQVVGDNEPWVFGPYHPHHSAKSLDFEPELCICIYIYILTDRDRGIAT